tara:strand:+ start:3037 stop:3522 length:486 start_codon:yes stop_codon:yes gene_type:complete
MFKIGHSKKYIENQLSKNYRKLNYNQFRWWRWYESRNKPLPYKANFKDKILNGDYDSSPYQLQAQLCEHMLNEILEECKDDYQKYLEKSKLLGARRKRLWEDYNKDENDKINDIYKQFKKHFQITREEIDEEVMKCRGELIDLYYIIEDKYKKKLSYKKYV